MLDKFSEELRAAREKKNITLQQMAAKTRIDIKFLEALDNGNFSFLPDLYVKAFIKQYAKVVDLDEEECVKKYELAREGKSYETEIISEEKEEIKEEIVKPVEKKIREESKKPEEKITTFTDASAVKSTQSSEQKNNAVLTIAISVIAVVAVAVVFYFLVINKSDSIIVEEKPFEEVLEQNSQRFVEDTKEDETDIVASKDSISVEFINIDTADSAWIMIIYDGKSKGDFLLYPKTSKSIKTEKNIKFTLGNSGVVLIKINGLPAEFDGKKRSVRHFKIDENGIERLFSPPTLTQE